MPAYVFLFSNRALLKAESVHTGVLGSLWPAHQDVLRVLRACRIKVLYESPRPLLPSYFSQFIHTQTNKGGTSRTKMNPHFLPAHHPPKAVIRDVLCGGLEVILGGGLVIEQWPTAGLTVSLLAQAVGEGIVPGEKRDMNWR